MALVALVAVVLLGGCPPSLTVHGASKDAVHGAAEGIATLPPERVAAMREALLGDVEIGALARELAQNAVEGGLDAMTEARLERLTEALVQAQLAVIRKTLAPALEELEPRIQEEIRRSVTSAMTAALEVLRAEADRDLGRWTATVVRTSVETVIATLGRSRLPGMDEAAAVANRLATEVGRGAVTGAVGEIKDVLPPELVRVYFREGGAGLVEGMREGFAGSTTRLESTLTGVTVVLSAILIGLGIAAGVLWRELRLSRKALAVVAAQVNAATADRAGLKQAIRASAEKNHVQEWLSTFLKERGL